MDLGSRMKSGVNCATAIENLTQNFRLLQLELFPFFVMQSNFQIHSFSILFKGEKTRNTLISSKKIVFKMNQKYGWYAQFPQFGQLLVELKKTANCICLFLPRKKKKPTYLK